MSLNIAKSVVDISDKVEVVLDLDSLGTRMRNSIVNAATSGLIKGYGAAGQIAYALRREARLPLIRIRKDANYVYLRFAGMRGHADFYDRLQALYTARQLADSGMAKWEAEVMENMCAAKAESGGLHFRKELFHVFNGIELPLYPKPLTGVISVNFKE